FPHGGGEPASHVGRADRTRPAGTVLEPGRQAKQDGQVLFDGDTDPWPLDLHGHLGARAFAVTQPGLVHLGDRCGGGRLGLQLGENLPSRHPQRLGYHPFRPVPRAPGPARSWSWASSEMNSSGSRSRRVDSSWPSLVKVTPPSSSARCSDCASAAPPSAASPRRSPPPRTYGPRPCPTAIRLICPHRPAPATAPPLPPDP